ncbi:MAG: nicotinamide mononucleotide transporter [Lachnospiraceae bacterium]|nr:nicotinamide mononucleotide transporter [Lachnospiraceae bacterium]
MLKSFKNLNRTDWLLWGISLLIVVISNLLTGAVDIVNLAATVVGVTALIFVAKGDVLGQVLTFVFAVLYSVTSMRFRYYGEILTYLGMTAPIALLSIVSWIRNPYEKGKIEVKIQRLSRGQVMLLGVLTVLVTSVFGWMLYLMDTPNLSFSIISITTSFLASALMLFRNSNYALAYAANDVVLIILWVLASLEDISYLPMIACFSMFFVNDLYGYINWRMRERSQGLVREIDEKGTLR